MDEDVLKLQREVETLRERFTQLAAQAHALIEQSYRLQKAKAERRSSEQTAKKPANGN